MSLSIQHSNSDQVILSNEHALSTVIAKGLLLAMMLILGVLAPFTFIAQLTGMSFRFYSIIGLLLALLSAAYAVRIFIEDYRNIREHDTKILILLLCLGILGLVLALLTNKTNIDDYNYVPNVTYFLQNPGKPMDFLVHYFYAAPPAPFVLSYNQITSMPYEYSQGILARFTKVNFLDIYYIFMPAIMGFMIPLANYFLLSKFTKNTTLALMGTTITVVLLLTLTEIERTFGNFAFPRIFQGKAVMISIGIPCFAAFSLAYFAQKSLKGWVSILATVTALVGVSNTSALLFPILAGILLISWGAAEWHTLKTKKMSFLIDGFFYLTGCSLAIFYLLFLFIKLKVNGGSDDPFSLINGLTFWDNMRLLINPNFPLTIIVVALMLLLTIFAVKGWQRRFVVAWALAMIALFLNPLAAKFLMGTLIPNIIYWRLIYLLPFPISAAVCMSAVINKFESKYKLAINVSVCALLALSVFGYLFHFSNGNQLDFATYKLPANDLRNAQAIVAVAPKGVMLAPENLYGIIPMISSSSPQIRTRSEVKGFWISFQEGVKRDNASSFVGGDLKYEADFIYVINQGLVDVVVCQSDVLDSPGGEKVMAALKKNGFAHKKVVKDYTIFSK
ncbi:MAG: DUF6077 domain-containing protein [Anaerolineales bacterium]